MVSREELDAEMQRARESWVPKSQKGGKASYNEKNLLTGKEQRAEGRAAAKASKRDKGRW